MSVSLEETRKIAALAKLAFDEDELEIYRGHLNEILAYVDKLNELNTNDIEPTYFIQNEEGGIRDDSVQPSLPIESVMKNAPSHYQGFFCVPKVIHMNGEKS